MLRFILFFSFFPVAGIMFLDKSGTVKGLFCGMMFVRGAEMKGHRAHILEETGN